MKRSHALLFAAIILSFAFADEPLSKEVAKENRDFAHKAAQALDKAHLQKTKAEQDLACAQARLEAVDTALVHDFADLVQRQEQVFVQKRSIVFDTFFALEPAIAADKELLTKLYELNVELIQSAESLSSLEEAMDTFLTGHTNIRGPRPPAQPATCDPPTVATPSSPDPETRLEENFRLMQETEGAVADKQRTLDKSVIPGLKSLGVYLQGLQESVDKELLKIAGASGPFFDDKRDHLNEIRNRLEYALIANLSATHSAARDDTKIAEALSAAHLGAARTLELLDQVRGQ